MIKQYKLNKRQNNYDITLYYKGVKVRVQFSGGNTYKGVLPKCAERDPFRQRAIEASQMFKDREIVLERTIAEPGDNKPAVVVQAKKVAKPAVVSQTKKVAAPVAPAPQPDPEPETEQTPAPEPQKDEAKEFANLGEAILYIAQTWQLEAKTEKEAREILKAHGINPKIKKG